ncbi:MAG: ABC transporter ATP-binding protein [Pseudomonadota bacterium]
MPVIRLESLKKSFGSTDVIKGIDLTMEDGEFTVFVGPSGCGKSTTLRMIAGLEAVTDGKIWIGDKDVTHLEPKERGLAMVFQDYALYPHMNIAKNMSFALRLDRRPQAEIDEKVDRVSKMLNINHLLHRKPAELSGGQRQRVAMGRALVRDTGTFLFDEPLSNLDAKLRAKMRTELAEMRDQLDKNMIYVTHDQIEAMTLGDKIVVMLDGEIQQAGSPQELFQTPRNKFVAGFIGSPSMNFIDATLGGNGTAPVARGTDFEVLLTPEALGTDAPGEGSKVTLGIRPTSFQPAAADAASRIDATVVVSEYLGANSILVTHVGEEEMLVEHDSATPVRSGTKLPFTVPPAEVMVFDPQTGLRL